MGKKTTKIYRLVSYKYQKLDHPFTQVRFQVGINLYADNSWVPLAALNWQRALKTVSFIGKQGIFFLSLFSPEVD